MMLDVLILDPWQAWVVALGSGLATVALRIMPVLAFRNIGSGWFRDVLDRTGFGIMGGIVAQTALRSGRAMFAGTANPELLQVGMLWAVMAVLLTFLLSVRFKWKLLATLSGLAFFALGGMIF
ncbi:MAG: AzlD domain-containing protein [Rhodospirillaceae bacterium]|nr:AzlD domain-containing protein [Rhodospirillaceae bacterium]